MGSAWACCDTYRVHPDQTKERYTDADTANDANAAAANDADANADTGHDADADTAAGNADASAAGAGSGADDDPALWYGPRIDRSGSPPQIW